MAVIARFLLHVLPENFPDQCLIALMTRNFFETLLEFPL